MKKRIFAAAAILPAFALMSVPAASEAPGRYTMSPTDNGFVRLDTKTGQMALCTRQDKDWACTDMPEDPDESRQRIEALEKENQELKEDVKRLEEAFVQTPGAAPAPKVFSIPDEKDVDKAFDYLETMIKKFRERAKRLEELDEKDSSANGSSEGRGQSL